jgi:hypothetical protein
LDTCNLEERVVKKTRKRLGTSFHDGRLEKPNQGLLTTMLVAKKVLYFRSYRQSPYALPRATILGPYGKRLMVSGCGAEIESKTRKFPNIRKLELLENARNIKTKFPWSL